MAKRKGNGGLTTTIVIVVAAFAILAKLIADYWQFFLAAAVAYAIYRYYQYSKKSQVSNVLRSPAKPSTSHIRQTNPATSTSRNWSARPVNQPQSSGYAASFVEDELISFGAVTNPAHVSDYKIPFASSDFKTARWLNKSESVTVAGIEIRGGRVYVGPSMTAVNGGVEPALIDQRKPVAKNGHYTDRHTNYWPNYSDISPQARRAYLLWLADGRSAPDADIGYVFLYFYGLERRIIIDILAEKQAQDELPELGRELKRLYAIYAAGSNSFKMYCGQLIEIVDAANQSSKLYEEDLGELPPSYGLPLPLRIAIGQAVRDAVPIPTHLALAWAERDPAISRKTPVQRCSEEFKKLFASEYSCRQDGGSDVASPYAPSSA